MSSSTQNILRSDPFGFGRFVNTPERKAIILWDYANCPVPSGVSVQSAVRNIRDAALKFGLIDRFEAYSHWSNNTNPSIKNDLSVSGVKLRDCPYDRKKDTVDKTLLIDMMVYALERPRTTTIILISDDRDYAYAISTLRNRGYPVKLLTPVKSLQSSLQVPTDLLDWNSIFHSELLSSERIDFSPLAHGEEEEEETEEEETEEEDEEDEEGEEQKEEEAEHGVEVEGREREKVEDEEEQKVEHERVVGVEGMKVEAERAYPPQIEALAVPAPAEIPPMWAPAMPQWPSVVVPLEPLSAQIQEQSQPAFLPTSLLSPSPSTQLHTFSPSNGGESNLSGPGESFLEQPIRHIPPKFLPLVQELEVMKAEGSTAPLWTAICLRVYKRSPSVLSKAGAKRWKDYMLLAEKEGIVDLTTERSGYETVSLTT